MAELEPHHQHPRDQAPPDLDPENNTSLRSRASSVISTGTKFSILTFPPESASQHNIDGVISSSTTAPAPPPGGGSASAPRLHPRPISLYSFRSTNEALPAYSESQPLSEPSPRPPHGTEIPDSPPAPEPPDPTTPTDADNALLIHYSHVVRTIDSNHARLLARTHSAHDAAVAALTSEIENLKAAQAVELAEVRNSIDAAYRRELKGRGREVERVREECAGEVERLRAEVEEVRREGEAEVEGLMVEAEARVAKAGHVVEELWEERWVRRNEVVAEEGRRSEREWRETCRVVVEEREGRWIEAVREVWGEEGMERVRGLVERVDGGKEKG